MGVLSDLELTVRGELRALRLGDGEVLVVSLKKDPSAEEADRIKDTLQRQLGDVAVIVHGPSVRIGKIERMP